MIFQLNPDSLFFPRASLDSFPSLNRSFLRDAFSSAFGTFAQAPKNIQGCDYVCLTLPVGDAEPDRFLNRLEDGTFSYFWESPSNAQAFLATGVRERLKATGESRFEEIASQSERLLSRIRFIDLRNDGKERGKFGVATEELPLIVGGYSFGPFNISKTWSAFGSSSFTLPEAILVRIGSQTILRLIVPIPESFPDSKSTHNPSVVESDFEALIDRTLSDCIFLKNNSLGDRNEQDESAQYRDAGTRLGDDLKDVLGADESDTLKTELRESMETQGKASWTEGVERAISMIRERRFEKIVLARELVLPVSESFDPIRLSNRLKRDFPDCTTFNVRLESGEHFLGASPEWLLRMKGGCLETDGLAGSTKRGKTLQEDILLGLALLSSQKDRSEHAYVVNQIKQALANYTTDIEHPEIPLLRKLRNVQHLHTPLKARLRSSKNIHHILGQLHPTPAVGGFPGAFAIPHIHSLEKIERGWYSGTNGWFNETGSGEFTVSIRSAIVHADRIRLYAGCGIVEHSIPEQEWEETCIKIHPLLLAYQDSHHGDA